LSNIEDIALITLNRPKVNAINGDLLRQLKSRFEAVQQDKKFKAIVLTSASPNTFSAGLDLPYMLSLNETEMMDWFHLFTDTLHTMAGCKLPTAAAITGHAPAGGCVFSLMMDYRSMAAGNFIIGLNEVRVGLIIPSGIAEMAKLTVGNKFGERMVLTGRFFNPSEALSIGLVDNISDQADVLTHCIETLKKNTFSQIPASSQKPNSESGNTH